MVRRLFLVLSLVGAREKLVVVIPPVIVAAIPVGIGAFLLLIGLCNMGLVVASSATLVALSKFTPPVVISVAGLFGTLALHIRRVPGAILLGIVGTTLAAAAAGLVDPPTAVFSSGIRLAPVAFRLDVLGALRWSLVGPLRPVLRQSVRLAGYAGGLRRHGWPGGARWQNLGPEPDAEHRRGGRHCQQPTGHFA